MLEFSIVLAKGQNEFFVEIAETIIDELDRAGHVASISREGFVRQRPGLINILLPPHEFYRLEGVFTEPRWDVLKRTIFICAEQPGTSFFEDDAFLGTRAGAVFDVSRASVAAFRRRGIRAQHFPLGWTPRWSRAEFKPGDSRETPERSLDVLHLGIFSVHRAKTIAAAGHELQWMRSRIVLSDDHRANDAPAANYAMGEDKWKLLRDTRVLLNTHVSERPYFEWQRIVQAICCGCAVVSEHSAGYAPLVPGQHFLAGGPEALGLLTRALVQDEDRRFAMARDAWLLLHDEQPFSKSVAALIDAAVDIDRQPVPIGRPEQFSRSRIREPEFEARERPPEEPLAAALKDIRLELMGTRRRFDRLERTLADGRPPPLVEHVAQTRAYPAARPRVSVITALYNYERHIAAAMQSAADSSFEALELIVVDDGSRDGSVSDARRWMNEHEWVPSLLVRHPINRGLGAARNTALDFARGEMVFVLDADNLVYPSCIAGLVDALDHDARAIFAYGMLEAFDDQGPVGLRSHYPWNPHRFRNDNFIDAMALIRSAWLRDRGGYTTDTRLHGWEDYDLWCAVAQARGYGAFVPTVVARYRATRHSMLTVTDISERVARSVLAERHPDVFAGAVV